MKIYCGTDIIEVERIKDAIENTKGFKENIYTENEINDIDNIAHNMKYQRYAGRFASKEAIYKAMSKILIDNELNLNFLDVEIMNIESLKRRPEVIILDKQVNDFVKYNKIDIDLSISHINETAIAMVVVKVNGSDENE